MLKIKPAGNHIIRNLVHDGGITRHILLDFDNLVPGSFNGNPQLVNFHQADADYMVSGEVQACCFKIQYGQWCFFYSGSTIGKWLLIVIV